MNVGPPGLGNIFTGAFHALTGVAIDYRPSGPEEIFRVVSQALTGMATDYHLRA
ncbi:MAG TPA: hypothetical protein VMS31_14485 [Pyrinomonadaceae bacterium]|nr:hypothetical protein [Pyrinomonadaceae bacterium]